MLKVISTTDLRTEIRRVLNEVGYGQAEYVVEKFGEPTAAIISLEDFRLLQAIKQQRAASTLRETLASIRAQAREIDPTELDALIEEARTDFYRQRSDQADAH
ncbi:MAG: type II toxin-antitoxin system Phd/YefM family antitoxin [Anaerolineae bacterium]|nr:type II toxin-antitoxin system Phd/YefM family antitoxin [Anaerolineae bacterium]